MKEDVPYELVDARDISGANKLDAVGIIEKEENLLRIRQLNGHLFDFSLEDDEFEITNGGALITLITDEGLIHLVAIHASHEIFDEFFDEEINPDELYVACAMSMR